jgi:hypothetical protein
MLWRFGHKQLVGGWLKGLQVLDGSVIKPLINERGMRPELTAPGVSTDSLRASLDNEFAATGSERTRDGDFSVDELADSGAQQTNLFNSGLFACRASRLA